MIDLRKAILAIYAQGLEFKMTKHKKPYPAWVCSDCGKKYGRRIPSLATYHIGVCGVCSKETMVTEPRDFGHLNFEVKL